MNQELDRQAFHLLHKLNSEVMTDVNIDCSKLTGMVAERKRVQKVVFLRMVRPDLLDGTRHCRTAGILLYGPAGNGKTVMAKLIAGHVTRRYINILPNYLDSPNAYQLLMVIFRLASQTEPSVIVFDDIDQTFRGKEKLQELFASEFRRSIRKRDHVLVIGTTRMGCYHKLPKKIVDCFEHRIEIALPDEKERRGLISVFMQGVRHNLTKSDARDIIDATESLRRGQLEEICRKVSSIPTRQLRPVTMDDFVSVLSSRYFHNSPEPIDVDFSSSMASSIENVSEESSGDVPYAHCHSLSDDNANSMQAELHSFDV